MEDIKKEVSEIKEDWRRHADKANQESTETRRVIKSEVAWLRQTYSEAAKSKPHKQDRGISAKPHYPLLVESADPRRCGDDIVRQIKDKVNIVELGVGVNAVRKLRNQRVIISCDSTEDRNTLSQAIKMSDDKLTVTQPPPKKPLVKLLGVAADLDDRQLEEAVMKQNSKRWVAIDKSLGQVRVMRRTKARVMEQTNVISETSPQIWKAIINEKIRVGYQIVRVVDQSPITQCYNCLGFGHRAGECRGKTRCGYCAEDHDTRTCNNRSDPAHCTNCDGENNHPAYSQHCPEWQKWDRIARNAVSYC